MEGYNKAAKSSILVIAIALARMGTGFFISIHGPTLLTLVSNVGSTVAQVSWLFCGRSIGILMGSIFTGPIMRNIDNLLGFGLTCLILCCAVIATPWITTLWLLITDIMIGGVMYGYLDAGMQALLLQLWGPQKSRGLISGYHFAIALGAFLAPLVAQPFLSQSNQGDVCRNSHENSTQDSVLPSSAQNTTIRYTSVATSQPEEINPVVWAYLICGSVLLVVCIIFLTLRAFHLETKVRQRQAEKVEVREEDSIKGLLLLFTLVCLFYLFIVGTESLYFSYVYSVSICSKLHFTATQGTAINSLFWAGLGIGRLGGVVFLRYITPRNVIIIDIVGTIVSMVIISVVGESIAEVTWAFTFIFGFFLATLYPAGVSWTSHHTNMSGNYIFIFSVGQAFGSMFLIPIGGLLFDINPFYVMYMVLGSCLCTAVVFSLMMWEGRRLKWQKMDRKLDRSRISLSSDSNDVSV